MVRLPLDPRPGPDERARPAPRPTPERLEVIARAIAAGAYRVAPERVAEAMLCLRALDQPGHPG